MWNKIKDSKAFYIVISIAAAIACWLYVDIVEAPEMPKTVSNIPVVFSGEEVLAEQGLMIVNGDEAYVTLTFSGPRSSVSQLNRNNVVITVPASNQIDSEGDYSLNYNISYPPGISGVSVTSRSSVTVDVSVVQMATRTLDIVGKFTGSVGDGYLFDEDRFTFGVETITIGGEKSLVDRVDRAMVFLGENDLTSTWRGELDIVLVDERGEIIDPTGLTLDHTTVDAIFPVLAVKEVDLQVDFIHGGGSNERNVSYSIKPERIMISGTEEELAQVESVSLGTINLSKVITSDELSFDIRLNDSLENISGISTATVSVKITGLAVRVFETENISLVNIPDGVSAQLITNSLTARIRGEQEAIDLVMNEDVYVTVDLTGVDEAGFGTCTVPAEVHVRGMSEVGAVGEYKVVVDIHGDN